jgi:hypothetical protein
MENRLKALLRIFRCCPWSKYGAIAFYLANRALIDAYLEAGEAEFQQLQQSCQEKSPLLYQKLKAAQARKQSAV